MSSRGLREGVEVDAQQRRGPRIESTEKWICHARKYGVPVKAWTCSVQRRKPKSNSQGSTGRTASISGSFGSPASNESLPELGELTHIL